MSDLNHVNDDRMDDAATDWTPGGDGDGDAPGFDEWNAIRAAQGKPPGDFSDYLESLRNDAAGAIVRMLARQWVSEGAVQLPAGWIDGPVPF